MYRQAPAPGQVRLTSVSQTQNKMQCVPWYYYGRGRDGEGKCKFFCVTCKQAYSVRNDGGWMEK